MRAAVLRGATDAEVDDALTPFERELAGAFRAVEAEAQRELRRALAEGLSPDMAVSRAAAVLSREV